LLLDEPTAGMNPRETEEMMAFIQRLRDELGITIMLIEHDMRVVMSISETITVMDFGEKARRSLRAARRRSSAIRG
jgi:branched-chain amino acid transport system ATP-binding protein